MVKVKQIEVETSITKTVKSNPIKKKSTLKNNLKPKSGFRPKSSRKKKNKYQSEKGVVYLSHIPHGFYEEQITGFFGQFGKVTQVHLPRSKSGEIKGYAFIEFVHPEVAKIAAETMNNYLMCNRLLKARYIPPQDQKPREFKRQMLRKTHNKTESEQAVSNRKQNRKLKNRMLKTSQEARVISKLQKKTAAMSQMMAELGMTYEVQVEEGNSQSVLERMKNLVEKRKLHSQKMKKLRKQAKANKKKNINEEGSSLASDEENLSSSDSNGENLLSSKDEDESSSENMNEFENHTSKRLGRMMNKPAKLVATPLVVNPSKHKHNMKSALGKKNKPIKSNYVVNKSHKENKSHQVPSLKLQNSLNTIKSVENNALLSKTIEKKQKGFQKKVTPSTSKSPNIIQGNRKQRRSLMQQLNVLTEQKSPAEGAIHSTTLNLLENDTFTHTPSKKLKKSEGLKETVQSPRMNRAPKSNQTPLKPTSKSPNSTQGNRKQRRSLMQQLKVFTEQKSPAEGAIHSTTLNLLENDTFTHTPSKKLKKSEELKEMVQSPRINGTSKSNQTPLKPTSKSPNGTQGNRKQRRSMGKQPKLLTPKSNQTPLKKSPKPEVTPKTAVGTPKNVASLKKSLKPTLTPKAIVGTPKNVASLKMSPKPQLTPNVTLGTPKNVASLKKALKPASTPRATEDTQKNVSSMKKSPKPTLTPKATVGTPKSFTPLKKSESVGKSPLKRKSQRF